MTVADVLAIPYQERTVGHWRVLVDKDRQASRPFVIVDPYDPEGLLYLSEKEYLLHSRVAANNDLTLIVIARPGTKLPTPIDASQNSPKKENYRAYFQSPSNTMTWKQFLDLRMFIRRNLKFEEGMVSAQSETIAQTVKLWARELLHYSGYSSPEMAIGYIDVFANDLQRRFAGNGSAHACKQLKLGLFALYSYLAGTPLSSTHALGLGVSLRNGLPAFIPRYARVEIRRGNLRTIRVWASLLNIYRSLKTDVDDPETAYAKIRTPLPDLEKSEVWPLWKEFCKEIFPTLVESQAKKSGVKPVPFVYESSLELVIRSAGANIKGPSIFSIIPDAKAWEKTERNLPKEWFLYHQDQHAADLMDMIGAEVFNVSPDAYRASQDKISKELTDSGIRPKGQHHRIPYNEVILGVWDGSFQAQYNTPDYPINCGPGNEVTGRLFNFEAPGGKLRTVAICDYWSQIALKPVHDRLFDLLKILQENDATFNQDGTVRRYHERKLSPHWSYDLSAATDTIPLPLYVECLAPFLVQKDEDWDKGKERAELWAKLIADREFLLPPRFEGGKRIVERKFIKYTTGQPMGAYSSWASMALVHHALVQFSSWLCHKDEKYMRPRWFSEYLVLGDDVDIAKSKEVSTSYIKVMESFSVKVNLVKSIKSNLNFFEFANQRFGVNGQLSPLSLSEEISSTTWATRIEFARRIRERLDTKNSSILKTVCTCAQWSHLKPEFGNRLPHLVSVLNFVLFDPFKEFILYKRPITVHRVISWLAKLDKSNEASAKFRLQSLNKILEEKVYKSIMDLVLDELRKALAATEKESLDSVRPRDSATRTPALGWVSLQQAPGGLPRKISDDDYLTHNCVAPDAANMYTSLSKADMAKYRRDLIHYGASQAPVASLYLTTSLRSQNNIFRRQLYAVQDVCRKDNTATFEGWVQVLYDLSSVPAQISLRDNVLGAKALGSCGEDIYAEQGLPVIGGKGAIPYKALQARIVDRVQPVHNLVAHEAARHLGLAATLPPYLLTKSHLRGWVSPFTIRRLAISLNNKLERARLRSRSILNRMLDKLSKEECVGTIAVE